MKFNSRYLTVSIHSRVLQVRVIYKPDIFYQTLLEKAKHAKCRITIASLYLGTGKLETDFVQSIETALTNSTNSNLEVKILLDANRGSRGEVNSRTTLLPLVKSYSNQVKVHLYHTPALNGVLKSVMPERWNEIIGLQHMKLYLFDDSLLISGANLSNDYFTNRQDRYLLIDGSKDLADFCDKLVGTVCEFSLNMDAANNLHLNPNWNQHPYEGVSSDFVSQASAKVLSLFEDRCHANSSECFQWPNKNAHDTWIFPLIQMGQLGINHDNINTQKIIESIPSDADMKLATGYFNLTQEYMDGILYSSQPNVHILMAHPSVNTWISFH